MLEDIKYAFEDTVHHLDWMDEITREKTLIKLHAIRAFVGYPGWIMNSTQLDNHYKEVNFIYFFNCLLKLLFLLFRPT